MSQQPLIVYYSKTGTTVKIVEKVLTIIKAESRRLGEPLGLRRKFLRFFQKPNDAKVTYGNIDAFDPILLLTPIWKGKPTMAMIEYLENIDLRGKRVVLGLVGANETNPKALEKLRRKAVERGCTFVSTIYLRGVLPGRNWTDLSDEDYLREANRLAQMVTNIGEFKR